MSFPKTIARGRAFWRALRRTRSFLASAASVIRALDPEKYEAVPIGISKDGRWLVGTGAQKMLGGRVEIGRTRVAAARSQRGGACSAGARRWTAQRDGGRGFSRAARHIWRRWHSARACSSSPDCRTSAPACWASAVGMDKDVQKRLFAEAGLPIVPFLAVRAVGMGAQACGSAEAIKKKFRFPIFVKPATLGSSVE